MAEQIPHLSSLRVFEAAARHLSFKAAADELGLSPSAVSHQIRTLESYLDVRLFERLTRAVKLTTSGRALRPGVEDGFRQIESAVRQVRAIDARSVIVVSAGPAIAAKWIVPRLHHFVEAYPSIEVRLSTSHHAVDIARGDVDVAIRHGAGQYGDLDSVRLFGEAYTPMCAPSLIGKGKPKLKLAADVLKHRLLHDDAASFPGVAPDWRDWLTAESVGIPKNLGGQHFKQSDHAIQAAIDGVGILFGRIAIAAPDLAAGRLIRPFERAIPSSFAFYFVTRRRRMREKLITVFLEWLQHEAMQMPGLPE